MVIIVTATRVKEIVAQIGHIVPTTIKITAHRGSKSFPVGAITISKGAEKYRAERSDTDQSST